MQWTSYLGPLWQGAWVTIELTILSTILGGIMSFAAGIGKLSPNWFIKGLSVTYIEIFRGTSLLVQLFWLYFALPIAGDMIGVNLRLPPVLAGVLALGLNIGAYGAEVVRGAIQSVPRGQYEAAIALNMSPYRRMRRIILPQAVLMMLPPGGNLLIELLKGTALVALISVADLMFNAKQINGTTFLSVQAFGSALVIYYVMARFMLTPAMRWFERHTARRLGMT